MREGLEIPDNAILGIIVTYCVVAGLITTFRLSVRNPSKWWWDDLCAFLGVLAIIFQVIVLWLRINRYPPLTANRTASIAFFYMNSMCFYIEDWGARCAILFSIIRITPGKRMRRYLSFVGIAFFLLYCTNVALLIGTCEEDPSWHTVRTPPRCKLTKAVPIFRIVTGILSDAILVIIPIYNLKKLKSAPGFRKTLIIIFGSSAWLTAACIVQAVITLEVPGDPELIASMTEGFIALLLCNLSVVVIAVMHLMGYNQTVVRHGIHGSVELGNGVQIQTLEETQTHHHIVPGSNANNNLGVDGGISGGGRRESVASSFKKSDNGSSIGVGGGGDDIVSRWKTMDIDAGDTKGRDDSASEL